MARKHSIALFLLLFGIGLGVSVFVDVYDFETYFYPAAVEIAHLRDPYAVPGVYSPPWALVMLAPLGWLPYVWAKAVFFGLMFACFFIVPIKLEFKWWALLLYLVSPPVIMCLWYGNLEWLCLLGLLLPGPWAIPFYLIKPQVGLGLVLYEVIRAKEKTELIVPLCFLIVLGFLFTTWQPLAVVEILTFHKLPNLNIFWPWSGIIAVICMCCAFLKKKRAYALVAGPFFSPYALLYSYAGIAIGILWRLGGKRDADS